MAIHCYHPRLPLPQALLDLVHSFLEMHDFSKAARSEGQQTAGRLEKQRMDIGA